MKTAAIPADALSALTKFACELAAAARAETLPRWRSAGAVDNKATDASFDPVTEADRAAEQAMRRLIEARYPQHGILGEEFPHHLPESALCWSLDPIDGTRAFICGLPSWTTLIALLDRGVPVIGAIDAPRLGERYLGYGGRSVLATTEGEQALAVSGCQRLAEARLSTTDPGLFSSAQLQAFDRVRTAARLTRYGHDAYAYARLAAGTIDLVVEAGLKPYDIHALVPVVRGAGGVIGNWQGGGDLAAGQLVAAASPALFEETVRLLNA